MAFDHDVQKILNQPGAGVGLEMGRVAAADVDGFTFTIATRFGRIVSGFGIMQGDGLVAYATAGAVSSGKATFTRVGSIETSADVCDYMLCGR